MLAFKGGDSARVAWIGQKCWPTFQLLGALGGDDPAHMILARSVFLDPLSDAEKFWAVSEAMRSVGVGCVVADGSGMTVMGSRRLQLAAEAGNALGLIARPPWEAQEPSHAATRWRVETRESETGLPSWMIELERCRGRQPGQDAPRRWRVEWSYQVNRGTGALHFSPDVGYGLGATADNADSTLRIA